MNQKTSTVRYRRIIDKIYEMIRLTTSISVSLNLQEILTNVLRLSEEIMEAEASSILLLDTEKQELYFEVALGDVGAELKDKFRVKVGQGISGWVAQTGEPLLIEDAYQDARFHRKFDDATGFRTRCILTVPLKVKERIIGVAQVVNKRDNRVFDEEDKNMFLAFCSLVAVAVENARTHKLELERDRFVRELEFGKEIQQSFLPKEFPETARFQVSAFNKPALEVGGDLYDVFTMPDGRICYVLGDVSGKGVSAALFMARFISDLRHMASQYDSPDKLLNALNELLCPRSHRGMFITGVIGYLDPGSDTIQIANAGHCNVIRLDRISTTTAEVCAASGPPLGIMDCASYETSRVDLGAGQLLVMYSDGISEAVNGGAEQYGLNRLNNVVRNQAGKNGGEIIDGIYRNVVEFTDGMKQKDDITLMIIERKDG